MGLFSKISAAISAMFTGSRGGKYFINKNGNKEYGTPPKGSKGKAAPAPAKKAPTPRTPKPKPAPKPRPKRVPPAPKPTAPPKPLTPPKKQPVTPLPKPPKLTPVPPPAVKPAPPVAAKPVAAPKGDYTKAASHAENRSAIAGQTDGHKAGARAHKAAADAHYEAARVAGDAAAKERHLAKAARHEAMMKSLAKLANARQSRIDTGGPAPLGAASANSPRAAEWKALTADVIKTGGFEKLLKKHPIRDIEYGDIGRAGTLGTYDLTNRNVVIQKDKSFLSFGYVPGKEGTSRQYEAELVGWQKGHDGGMPQGERFRLSMRACAIHEVAHHMHNMIATYSAGTPGKVAVSRDGSFGHVYANGNLPEKNAHTKMLNRIYAQWRKAQTDKTHGAVSRYARDSHLEWFAETHTAYSLHKQELKENRPKDYAVIRDARKLMGMEE